MDLNNQSIGSYIKFMRQRAGLTQSELAARIGVGGKTVSKWEQGRGIPDISLLYSLSLELDVDIESLLAGNLHEIGRDWIGIIYIGGMEEPHLEKRAWERMLSMFLLVGIRDIFIVDVKGDADRSKEFFGEFTDRGFLRNLCCMNSFDELMQRLKTETRHICLLYQPAFLYGMHLTRYMRRAMLGGRIKALALRQGQGSFMPKICFDNRFFCIDPGEAAESEWHLFPMLFDRSRIVIDFLEQKKGECHQNIGEDILMENFSAVQVEAMERGMLAFSFQTKRNHLLAKQVLEGIEESQNIRIGSLEDIIKVRGWK